MIHNHGTEDGPGLSCREHRRPDGTLRGACLPREKWTLMGRISISGNGWYVWGRPDRPERWACRVDTIVGRTVGHDRA